MSLINLFVAAKAAIASWRQKRRAYDELMALDDRSLADIGLHRSQIPAIVEGMHEATSGAQLPAAMGAPVLGPGFAAHRLYPRV
jgi:uncharacterized protein YjiS (DUF1127 family)